MNRFLAALALATLAFAEPLPAGEIAVDSNLTYAAIGELKLQLDLARPAEGDGPFPAIVFIHGGGWSGGNRHAFRGKMEEAARRGFVAATISYRLTEPDPETGKPKQPFPAQIHDCKAAIRWLRAHAADYHIDPQRMGVAGASAGGHLSLLVGLTTADDGLEGDKGHLEQSSRVQAVVNIFGPTDLPTHFKSTPAVYGLLKALCNGTLDEAPQRFAQASPITYVSADDPPILTLHGSDDKLVPLEQAKILQEKLDAAGITNELVVLEGQGHGFRGESAEQADTAMWAFFDKHLRPTTGNTATGDAAK